MSKRSISTFALNSESYVNSDDCMNCEARKELLNSVNRSNVNGAIIINFGEEEEKFTTLMHAALSFGDKFMCDRLLSIKETKLNIVDSDGQDVLTFARKSNQSGGGNKAVKALLEFVGEGDFAETERESDNEGLISRCFKKLFS